MMPRCLTWMLFAGQLGVKAGQAHAKGLQGAKWILEIHGKSVGAHSAKLQDDIVHYTVEGRPRSSAGMLSNTTQNSANGTVKMVHNLEILNRSLRNTITEI